MSKNDERRKHKRYYFKALLQIVDTGEYSNVTMEAINISAGGIFFRSSVLLEVDQEAVLIFSLPDYEQPIQALCRVVHSLETIPGKQYFVGVKFIKLEGIKASELSAHLQELFD